VIGRMQLKRLADWTTRRTANAKILEAAADTKSIFRVPRVSAGITHAFYKYYIFTKPEALKEDWSRDRIIHEINLRGIPCYQGSCPEVYLEKSFDYSPSKPKNRLPVARDLGETGLMFLVHPTLTDEEMGRTATALCEVADHAAR
jgi:dTDP-4-amino-4,6-dideoxygalactose transaminase